MSNTIQLCVNTIIYIILSLIVIDCSHCSYSLLEECWKIEPQRRPRFSEIVVRIDTMMEERFGYMRMNTTH